MFDFLKGRRTYIVGLGLIVTGVGQWLSLDVLSLSNIFVGDHWTMVLEGLGLMGLRASVDKL